MVDYWAKWVEKYPIRSIEDGFAENDWDGWKMLTDRVGEKVQLVGDDLFVTNVKFLEKGIKTRTANSILVKVNQIGTLSETFAAVNLAMRNGYTRRAVAPQRRNRRRDDRRHRRRDQLRPDQDRRAGAIRSRGEVQPAPAHRRAARRQSRTSTADTLSQLHHVQVRLAQERSRDCALVSSRLSAAAFSCAAFGRRRLSPGRFTIGDRLVVRRLRVGGGFLLSGLADLRPPFPARPLLRRPSLSRQLDIALTIVRDAGARIRRHANTLHLAISRGIRLGANKYHAAVVLHFPELR